MSVYDAKGEVQVECAKPEAGKAGWGSLRHKLFTQRRKAPRSLHLDAINYDSKVPAPLTAGAVSRPQPS